MKIKLYLILILVLLTVSCVDNVKHEYPIYTLQTINYIPDSLKKEHSKYIIELTRAASQYISGGDYEDVPATISQAKFTADELFGISVVGMRKDIDGNYYNYVRIKPCDFTEEEKQIFDSLQINLN